MAFPSAPHPSPERALLHFLYLLNLLWGVLVGTSQTCLRVQGQLEVWEFRGLEAWLSRWGSAPHPYNSSVARLPGALFSVAVEGLRLRRCTLWSPFSGAALAAPPLPGRGAAPHSLPISQSHPAPSACASTPKICINLRNLRFPILTILCVPLWFFVSFVIAAQRPVTSSPEATARARTSGAPPSLQTSKLPNFQSAKIETKGTPP